MPHDKSLPTDEVMEAYFDWAKKEDVQAIMGKEKMELLITGYSTTLNLDITERQELYILLQRI